MYLAGSSSKKRNKNGAAVAMNKERREDCTCPWNDVSYFLSFSLDRYVQRKGGEERSLYLNSIEIQYHVRCPFFFFIIIHYKDEADTIYRFIGHVKS